MNQSRKSKKGYMAELAGDILASPEERARKKKQLLRRAGTAKYLTSFLSLTGMLAVLTLTVANRNDPKNLVLIFGIASALFLAALFIAGKNKTE